MFSVFTNPVDGSIAIEQRDTATARGGHIYINSDDIPSLIKQLVTHLGPDLRGDVSIDISRDVVQLALRIDHSRVALAANRLPAKFLAEELIRQAVNQIHHKLIETIDEARG